MKLRLKARYYETLEQSSTKAPSGRLTVAVGFIPRVEKRLGKQVVTGENFKGLVGKEKKKIT